MLRIAVQAKGRLYEETMLMLSESSIKIESGKRTLLIPAKNFPIEVLFLRDDDIPQAVASGIADVGVVGENEYAEKQEDAEIVKRLDFSKCRLSLAIPKSIDYQGVHWFEGKKIATSYPVILENFLKNSPPFKACEPSCSWEKALPISCNKAALFATSIFAPISAASADAI